MSSSMIFAAGDKVEVKGSRSWFPATVFCFNEPPDDNLMVHYTTTAKDDCSVDSVSISSVRPSPPPKRREFCPGEFVEVFQDSMGWRGGKLLGLCQDTTWAVLIGGEDKPVKVDCRDLRPWLHWIDDSWISHSLNKKRKSEAEMATRKIKLKIKLSGIPKGSSETKFSRGSKVEVRSDEDGYEGARYAATLVGLVKEKTFLVEYHTIRTDDLSCPLREEIKEENIRPYPPKTPRKTTRYRKGEAVDVWYHEGWWEGVISKVIDESTYRVYFATTDEELMYRRSCLRPHQDWIDGEWTTPPRKNISQVSIA